MVADNPYHKRPAPQSRNKIASYAALSFASFLCGLGILALLIWKAEQLVELGLSGNLYYIALLPLGISAALVLFGAMRSYAHYRGEFFGGSLELGGPVVLFALVVIGGFKLPPPSSNFPLTVYVHGSGGPQDLIIRAKGYVFIDTGGSRRTAAIDANGQAIFTEIPANFRGLEATVGLDADGYELADPNQKIRLTNGSAYLQVRRKPGRIAGHVQDERGVPLAGVSIAVAGMTTSTQTDGSFDLPIPGERIQPELILRAVAPGYAPWSDTVVPNSNEMTITLVRER